MDFSNEDSLHLIQEYSWDDLLWYPKHTQHFHKIIKADAWDKIAESCGIGVGEVKKKMSRLLGSFKRKKAKDKKSLE